MMDERIIEYLHSSKGKAALKKYCDLCNIKPQNLYVEESNYEMRYIHEHVLINKCIRYFMQFGFSTHMILKNIPEIEAYYPFFRDYDYSDDYENAIEYNFATYLRELNVEFYKKVNPRKYGEYYTSLDMINVALPELEFDIKHRVIDPSCGSGFILYAYLMKLIEGEKKYCSTKQIICSVKEQIYGFDVFPAAIITTKFLLGYSIYKQLGISEDVFSFKNIKVFNTLSSLKCKNKGKNKIPQFDLIIGNPPFFRVNPNGTDNICKCTQYGHHYSHSLFLHWSLQYLQKDGVLCLILPESMLTGYYYQKVRSELLDLASIKNIIISKEHEKMFDVQQDVMILIAKNGEKNNYYFTSSNENGKIVKKYKLPVSICLNKNSVIPVIMNDYDMKVIESISKEKIVDSLFEFKVSTGNFVWNQNKEKCFMSKGKKRVPLISGPSIVDGKVIIEHKRKNTYMYCEPEKEFYVLRKKMILFRRMSPMENPKRFIGAIVEPNKIGSYVVENHVNLIEGDEKKLNDLFKLMNSNDFNHILKIFCRTNQVSVSDINIIFEILYKIKDGGLIER